MTAPEHRAGVEFRVAGRTLAGVAMVYGDVSPDYRERFVDRNADEQRRDVVARLRQLKFKPPTTGTTLDVLRDLRS